MIDQLDHNIIISSSGVILYYWYVKDVIKYFKKTKQKEHQTSVKPFFGILLGLVGCLFFWYLTGLVYLEYFKDVINPPYFHSHYHFGLLINVAFYSVIFFAAWALLKISKKLLENAEK
jgi:uncharacterized membrane protein YbhN (UPF0104 family)